MHSYGGEAPFFEGLSKAKLLGTQCVNQKCEYKGSVYIPFRIFCPDCLTRMKIVDLTAKAKKVAHIYSFIVTSRTGAFNTLEKPIKFIDIQIGDACTILKSYQLVGEPEIGQRVVPVFRVKPTYTITDLAWVVAGTKKAAQRIQVLKQSSLQTKGRVNPAPFVSLSLISAVIPATCPS